MQLEDGPHAPTTAKAGDDPLDILAVGLERRRNKQPALDHITATPLGTWSTPALLNEQRRINAVLAQAPSDRTADLGALTERRSELAPQIEQARAEVARLEARKRPRRERKTPDIDLHVAQRNLGKLTHNAEQVDQALAAAHASQHRRNSHLAAHHADTIALDQIDHLLADRRRLHINRIVQNPPGCITKTLGPRPAELHRDRKWVGAALEIETYRFNHNITNQRTLLGGAPEEAVDHLDWLGVRDTIKHAHRALTAEQVRRDLTDHASRRTPRASDYRSPGRDGPSFGVGL